jgi:hypothetical protein
MATTTEPTIVKHFPASEHPRLLEDILGDKQQHAVELRDRLAD